MTRGRRLLAPILASVVGLVLSAVAAPPTFANPRAQESPPSEQEVSEEPRDEESQDAEGAEDAPVEAATDADRILRSVRVIELDRLKLAELQQELEEKQAVFRQLGEDTLGIESELEEAQAKLAELDPAESAGEIGELETTIERLEENQDLFKTQLDLEFTAESTIREQIEALEKKIEREERAVNLLQGLEATEPGTKLPAPTPAGQRNATPASQQDAKRWWSRRITATDDTQ